VYFSFAILQDTEGIFIAIFITRFQLLLKVVVIASWQIFERHFVISSLGTKSFSLFGNGFLFNCVEIEQKLSFGKKTCGHRSY